MRPNRNSMPLVLLLLALLPGCKKEESPAPAPAPSSAKPKPAAPVQTQLSSAVRPGGALDFSRRTDPFKPFLVAPPAAPAPGGTAQVAPPAADLLPIQSFEVSKFKVAGIIAGLDQNRALVLDPTGKGYVVQAGMEIGNAGGRVSRITANSVEVIERYKESGRTKTRTIVLTLAKKR